MSSLFLAVLSDNFPYNKDGIDLLSVQPKRPQVKMSKTLVLLLLYFYFGISHWNQKLVRHL